MHFPLAMIEIIGHRGYSSLYPENTILSFRKAIEAGCKGIELDLQLSKDNEVVVIHDSTLERTTDKKGRVNSYTFQQLRKVNAGNKERIPALIEVLEEFRNVKLLLELKAGNNLVTLCKKSLDIANKTKSLENLLFVSFDLDAIKILKKINPKIATGLIFSKNWPTICEIDFLPNVINALCPRKDRINANISFYAKQNKLQTYIWTINTKDDLRKTDKYNTTGIITDNPGLICNLNV